MGYRLGILGFGNMGSAIAEGALINGVVNAGDVFEQLASRKNVFGF